MLSPSSRIQSRLLTLAAAFVTLYALALTLAPAARARNWAAEYHWDHWLGWLVWLGAWIFVWRMAERRLTEHDPYILPIVALLTGWGLFTIWRLAPNLGLRQALWLAVSAGVLGFGIRFLPRDLGFLRRYKYLWLTGGLLLTALTLIFGANPLGGGPRLWLGCCGLYFQPAEPLKLLLIIYLAAYLAEQFAPSSTPRKGVLIPTIIMTSLALAIMAAQRDLGTASLVLFLYAIVVYTATGQKRVAAACTLGVIVAGLAGYALFDVVRLRVDAWLNPWLDPSGRSYQIVQSLLTVASGGLTGRGPGLGNPGFVPVAHSDFIFTAIAEETGLPGALGLLALLALFTARGLHAAIHAPTTYHRTLAAGLSAYIGGQSIVIIGGNLRLLPLTGVTLPFVSYGGSSLLVSMLAVLLLLLSADPTNAEALQPSKVKTLLHLNGLMLCGFAACALLAGWWGVIRGPELLERTDNPRRAFADRFVPRGRILDRNNAPLAETTGLTGELTRQYPYPALGPLLGYNSATYGHAGLEASIDPYLRGLQGNPALAIWWEYLLYGQPPAGIDVRLSLDLDLQRTADRLLGDQTGALALLNAQTGEILALASHPGFDGNLLDSNMDSYLADSRGPLVNRAVQGLYPLGAVVAAWNPRDFTALGLYTAPAILLPTASGSLTDEKMVASPLQMAIAASTISNGGVRPAPMLVLTVNTSLSGWVLLPASSQPQPVWTVAEAAQMAKALSDSELPTWQQVITVPNGEAQWVTWYIGGTQPGGSSSTPLGLAVLLEKQDSPAALEIGRAMLEAVIQP